MRACIVHTLFIVPVPDTMFSSILLRRQFLFTSDAAEELKQVISMKNHELVYLYNTNLVDEIWKESRPKPPNKPVRVHDLKYAGLDVASKMSSLRSELVDAGSSAIIISRLDEIAWLLNLVMYLKTFTDLKYLWLFLYIHLSLKAFYQYPIQVA